MKCFRRLRRIHSVQVDFSLSCRTLNLKKNSVLRKGAYVTLAEALGADFFFRHLTGVNTKIEILRLKVANLNK